MAVVAACATAAEPNETTMLPSEPTTLPVSTTSAVETCANGPGTIYTMAGIGGNSASEELTADGDGGPALQAQLVGPYDLAFGPDDNLYVMGDRIRRIDQDGTITTVVGPPTQGGTAAPGDAGSLDLAPGGIAFDPNGVLHVVDNLQASRVLRIGPSGEVETVAGGAGQANLDHAVDIVFDRDGRLYISEYSGPDEGIHLVKVVDANGATNTFAGIGESGFSGDNGLADEAQLHRPEGLAMDEAGNLYIADEGNGRIRIVDPAGTIRTFAGGGAVSAASLDDDTLPTDLKLTAPTGVAVSEDGTVFIAEYLGHRVWKVAPNGDPSILAGNGFGMEPFEEEGVPAAEAHFDHPSRVAIGPDGNLYIVDHLNGRVRMICL
jgi:DNA-binding beta-propeller fold protein YncE